jgi:hypothetical protein
MEHIPSWEAISHSASQGITRLLWNQKLHYRAQNIPSLVPSLSQMHPVHVFTPKIHKGKGKISPVF